MGLISALSDRSIRVIPVLIETCSVPLRLRDLRWVDFRSDYSKALADLVGSIGAGSARETSHYAKCDGALFKTYRKPTSRA